VATIQSELQDLDGVSAVKGNPDAKTITVEWQSPATTSQIKSKLSEIGYPASA
jgi:copper chaperone CopZ